MSDDKKKPRGQVVAYGYRRNRDGSIQFQDDVPDDARAEILAEHERALEHEAKRRELWGEIGPGAMTRLAKRFPSLRNVPGVDPWDALQVLEWLCGPAPTSGSTQAALFVLGVWNDQDWAEVAREALPERQCHVCKGVGRVARDNGGPVRAARPGVYVQTEYDDDDKPHDVEVQTTTCERCDGKGRYRPSPGPGRFNVFRALSVWDQSHRDAFETWVRYPFWS